jgi:tetratricopeptide (TPR) repeat protein
MLAGVSLAQNTPRVTLDTSQPMFAVLTSINACGYDEELNLSNPLRAEIRQEVAHNIADSEEAKQAADAMCEYYRDHQDNDPSKTLTKFVSLALYTTGPPFVTKVKDAELPPDARAVVTYLQLLQVFYDKAGLEQIWQKNRNAYAALTDRYHEPVAKMLFETEVYLKIPSSVYLGRQFTVYLDPMGAPGQVNARNYGPDYYVVISPSGPSLRMQEIRHTYLHYLLDPLAMKNGAAVLRLQPLLQAVKTAPLEEQFKTDISLLVTECFVRAIEARTMGTKVPDAEKLKAVQQSEEQGFILTQFLYDALITFEKDPVGLRNSYADILGKIDVGKEAKRASQIEFARNGSSELLHLSHPVSNDHLLVTAEQRLGAGDLQSAQKLAQQAIDEKREDQGRALFILAQVAIASKDMQGARNYFEQALQVAQEPKVVAWSHIYLGRIFDLQENREAALTHYRAALDASSALPAAKSAAERGIASPYEPPAGADKQQ